MEKSWSGFAHIDKPIDCWGFARVTSQASCASLELQVRVAVTSRTLWVFWGIFFVLCFVLCFILTRIFKRVNFIMNMMLVVISSMERNQPVEAKSWIYKQRLLLKRMCLVLGNNLVKVNQREPPASPISSGANIGEYKWEWVAGYVGGRWHRQ